MRSPLVVLVPAALALVAGVAVAVATLGGGCGSCGDCPPTSVQVIASANVNVDIAGLAFGGEACVDAIPLCRGDDMTTSCTHITINASAPGECRLGIQFASGLVQVVHAEFGPKTKSCCRGFPVIGETTFVFASGTDAGVVGADGPTDAVVTILPDASADVDAGAAD